MGAVEVWANSKRPRPSSKRCAGGACVKARSRSDYDAAAAEGRQVGLLTDLAKVAQQRTSARASLAPGRWDTVARMADQSFGAMRAMLIVRGFKVLAALFGFLEVLNVDQRRRAGHPQSQRVVSRGRLCGGLRGGQLRGHVDQSRG